jgi:hypothetical protein
VAQTSVCGVECRQPKQEEAKQEKAKQEEKLKETEPSCAIAKDPV